MFVSILILLEVILEVSFPFPRNRGNRVSILILLEVILEECDILMTWITDSSFNPYFTGSNSGSLIDAPETVEFTVFQSLFYWK